MTTTSTTRVLAVDPGARYMGVAILVGDELIRADVENVRDTEARHTLERWIARYQPDILAIELPEFAQSKASRQLRQLVRAILATGKQAGLDVRTYVPTTVRRRMCPRGRPTRLTIAREVAERFPWLAADYQKKAAKSWWEKPYWLTMFDAVAVGLVCHEDRVRRRSRDRAA